MNARAIKPNYISSIFFVKVPTIFDNYQAHVNYKGTDVKLDLYDTGTFICFEWLSLSFSFRSANTLLSNCRLSKFSIAYNENVGKILEISEIWNDKN